MAPNLPRGRLSADDVRVCTACHALLLGGAAPLARAYRPMVKLSPLTKAEYLSYLPQPNDANIDVEEAQRVVNIELAKRLLSISPTEASVERVFSALKINVSRLRTRCNPVSAVAQVLYNVCRRFMQTATCTVSSPMAISPATFLWVVQHGVQHNKLAEPEGPASANCVYCDTAHEDPEKLELFGPTYKTMLICTACGRWFGQCCLPLTPEEAAAAARVDFVCDQQECKSRPAWYKCQAYMDYELELIIAEQRRNARKK
jgi:hypothetical protein